MSLLVIWPTGQHINTKFGVLMNVLEEDDNTAFCHLKKERFSSIYVMLCQSVLDFDEVQKGNAVNLFCGEHYCGCLLVAAKNKLHFQERHLMHPENII